MWDRIFPPLPLIASSTSQMLVCRPMSIYIWIYQGTARNAIAYIAIVAGTPDLEFTNQCPELDGFMAELQITQGRPVLKGYTPTLNVAKVMKYAWRNHPYKATAYNETSLILMSQTDCTPQDASPSKACLQHHPDKAITYPKRFLGISDVEFANQFYTAACSAGTMKHARYVHPYRAMCTVETQCLLAISTG